MKLYFIFALITTTKAQGTSSWLEPVTSIAQIFFYVVIAIVTILSFYQAKKSLFMPIKTETFKLQVESFKEILNFFSNKSDNDFITQFDYEFMVHANATLLFSDYLKCFFKGKFKVNDENIDKLHEKFGGFLPSEEVMDNYFAKIDYYDDIELKENDRSDITAKEWKEEKYGIIHISEKYIQEREKLRDIISSPLLPGKLKDDLNDFEKVLDSNISLIRDVLNEIKQEIPEKFDTVESVKKFSQSGVWNEYSDRMEDFEPSSHSILKFIRNYLKIDGLIQ